MISQNEILTHLGIEKLNAMQQEAFGAIADDRKNDVVILSPTGTGKTLAYLLPLVRQIDMQRDALQAVVIVPGRELALQSLGVLKSMGVGIRASACYGGRMTMEEHRQLQKDRPQIVFGTPGRLNDHFDKQNLSPAHVSTVVIDEFDKCLEMGFLQEMHTLLGRFALRGRRNILLSATDAEQIPLFVNMRAACRIDFRRQHEEGAPLSDRIRLFRAVSLQKDKLPLLRDLLLAGGDKSTVVFVNHRDAAERVAGNLSRQGFSVSTYHGGLEQNAREEALYLFSNGSANVLVATDLASRGLDVPEVDTIIHYHLPETEQNYIHRCGRTARWDRQGRVVFLLSAEEQVPAYVKDDVEDFPTETLLQAQEGHPAPPRMVTLYIGKGRRDKISRGDIVGFLCKVGQIEASRVGKITVYDRYAYAAVERQQVAPLLRRLQGQKLKGQKTVVERKEPRA